VVSERGRRGPAVLALAALLAAAGCSSAPTPTGVDPSGPAAATGVVPGAVPAGGMRLEQIVGHDALDGVEAYLYPIAGTGGLISRQAALAAAETAAGGDAGSSPRALAALVTLPLTVPPPGVAANPGEVLRHPAWVVEYRLASPVVRAVTCATGRRTCPPVVMTHGVWIVDGHTGRSLGGYETD